MPVLTTSIRKDFKLLLPGRVTYAAFGPTAVVMADVVGEGKSDVSLKAQSAFTDTTNMVVRDDTGALYAYLVKFNKNIKIRELNLRPAAPAVAEEPVKAKKEEKVATQKKEKAKDVEDKKSEKAVTTVVVPVVATASSQDTKKEDVKSKDTGAGRVKTNDASFASALTSDVPMDDFPQEQAAAPVQLPREGRDTIFVSDVFTSHMIYPSEINYADLSNQKLVAAKIIEGSKNKLAIKAREQFTSTASLSVEEANGAFHTYIVAYRKEPSALILDFRKSAADQPPVKVKTVEISDKYTTHFIFGTDITYADLSRPSILAGKLVDQGRNKLALKAKGPFRGLANVSIEEANGAFHTYYLKYAEAPESLVMDARPSAGGGSAAQANYLKRGDAPSLQAVSTLPRQLYHTSMREYQLTLSCENIFAYSDMTYLVLTLQNDSGISYETEDAIFVLETKQGGRRRPPIESTILPKNKYGKLTTGPFQESRVAYSFEKITLAKDQRICIYVYESGGRRELKLILTAADINGATSPFAK